jgi:anti-anti-sigma factor
MADIDVARDGTIGLYIRWHEGTLVIALSGDLDMTTSDLLGDTLTCLLESESFLVVDLQDVAFADSAGLAPIVEAALWAEHDGGAVQVINPPQSVQKICGVWPQMAEALGLARHQLVALSN